MLPLYIRFGTTRSPKVSTLWMPAALAMCLAYGVAGAQDAKDTTQPVPPAKVDVGAVPAPVAPVAPAVGHQISQRGPGTLPIPSGCAELRQSMELSRMANGIPSIQSTTRPLKGRSTVTGMIGSSIWLHARMPHQRSCLMWTPAATAGCAVRIISR